jgi:SM-20-related protein
MYKEIYKKITDALVNNGYIVIENALDVKLANNLKIFAEHEANFKKAGISVSSDLHIDTNRRRDKIDWLDNKSIEESEFLSFANGLKTYLNKELYLGLRYYESHFAIYEKGDFYETHFDNFKNFKNRIVTTVYYLNDNWSDEDGGELIIYDENHKFLSKVIPKANTLVVFMSEKFPHEVKPAKKNRFSIAGWYRIDK